MAARIIFSMGSHGSKRTHTSCAFRQLKNNNIMPNTQLIASAAAAPTRCILARSFSVNPLSKNLQLITSEKKLRQERVASGINVVQAGKKPLVVMISWLMAKPKHVHKYARFYTDQGFDVLTVYLNAWQMLWPVKGSQVVAGELVEFLNKNYLEQPLLLHGFSVAGYLWGEVLVKILEQPKLFKPIVNRFVGQVWDSAADITELPYGFPRAVFPRNKVLQAVTEKYIRYHMRAFDKVATCHYIRSSQMFHTNMVKAPALFLLSKTDPIGSEESNKRVHDSWAAGGTTTYWKCWDKSPHVGHFRKYPIEYVAELNTFLKGLNMNRQSTREKIQATNA